MSLTVYSLNPNKTIVRLEEHSNKNKLDEVSLLLPQGVYSTFRTFDNATKVLGLRTHLKRVFEPAANLSIRPTASMEEVRAVLRDLLSSRGYKDEVRVRISLSLSSNPGQIYLMLEKLAPINEIIYQSGVHVLTTATGRENPRLKSTSFITKSAEERKSLLQDDIYEILLTQKNKILEGMTSNFYSVQKGILVTAQKRILLGVTRSVVIRLVRRAGYLINYRQPKLEDIVTIDEAFITSSSRGIVPVVKINDLKVGQGVPGPISKQLRQNYDLYVTSKSELI